MYKGTRDRGNYEIDRIGFDTVRHLTARSKLKIEVCTTMYDLIEFCRHTLHITGDVSHSADIV